jgi:hypothetical protein
MEKNKFIGYEHLLTSSLSGIIGCLSDKLIIPWVSTPSQEKAFQYVGTSIAILILLRDLHAILGPQGNKNII